MSDATAYGRQSRETEDSQREVRASQRRSSDDFTLAPPPPPDHARWPIWRAMTEADWQDQVIRMATRLGYRWYHPWTGLHSPFGYPDLTLVRANDPERGWAAAIIWLELKREGKRPTDAQFAWLREIRSAGCPAFVIYPHDEDALEALLR